MNYRRERQLYAALALLGIVTIGIVVVLWRIERARWASERGALIAALEEPVAQDDQTGGAEIAVPEPERRGAWTFPVHEDDYLALTSPYGYRVSPILQVELWHQGVDIAAAWRAQVVAMADGVVVEHWPAPGTRHPSGAVYRGHDVYGAMIMIEHANGWRSLYAHMDTTRVHTGQRVSAGEVIGRIGSTGQARGAHLHVEIMDAVGRRMNPLLYIQPGGDHD